MHPAGPLWFVPASDCQSSLLTLTFVSTTCQEGMFLSSVSSCDSAEAHRQGLSPECHQCLWSQIRQFGTWLGSLQFTGVTGNLVCLLWLWLGEVEVWVLEAQSSIHSCSLFSEASMQWSVAGHPGLADVGHTLGLMPVESLRAKRVRGPQVWGAEYAESLLCCLPWCPGRARQPSLGNVSGDFTVSVERSILLQLGSSVSFHCQASWEHLG